MLSIPVAHIELYLEDIHRESEYLVSFPVICNLLLLEDIHSEIEFAIIHMLL